MSLSFSAPCALPSSLIADVPPKLSLSMDDATLLKRFETFLRTEKHHTEHTVEAYRNDLRRFMAYTAPSRAVHGWRGIGRKTLNAYTQQLEADGRKSATIARRVAGIKVFFGWLSAELSTQDPVCDFAYTEHKGHRIPVAVLSREQVAQLLSEPTRQHRRRWNGALLTPLSLRDDAILRLLYTTGIRATELVDMNVTDVRLDGDVPHVVTRGRNRRAIKLDDDTVAALRRYISDDGRAALQGSTGDVDALMLSAHGQRMTRQGLWLMVKYYAARIGLNMSAHTLRHSYAVHELRRGVPLRDVQATLGHGSYKTTQELYRPKRLVPVA